MVEEVVLNLLNHGNYKLISTRKANYFLSAIKGNEGIGTESPTTKLQVSDGDVYIDNIGSGVIMKSPNGACWRLTIDNSGQPVITSITCP